MKNTWPIITLLLILAVPTLSAQDPLAGTITYQQVLHYSFENIIQAHGDDQRTQDWMASLPTEGTTVQVLNFNSKEALFEEDDSEREATPPGLQRALMYENSLKAPRPLVQKVYLDLEKAHMLQQVEYLTRVFLVKSDVESIPWKLGTEKKKILDYTCMAASVTLDDQEIVAWFSPELPVSLGPSVYGGLPGLILAVERNGETAYVATSVGLTPPDPGSLEKPEKGTKITKEEFTAIQEEKEKEWKENSQGGGENYHR